MKLLVVKVSALGDVVHALPVLPYLKSVDPGMEIHWLVEEQFAPLLEGHPALRQVWRIRTRQWRRRKLHGAVNMFAAGYALRRQRFDVVLDLQGNSKSGFFTWMAGAPERFGFDTDEAREWPNRLAINRKVPLPAGDCHVTDRALAIANGACPGGQNPPPAGPLPVEAGASLRVLERLGTLGLTSGPIVVLHCGTTWETKLWSHQNWVRLGGDLGRHLNLRPVLTWGNRAELAVVGKIADVCGSGVSVWPGGDLPELAALLKQADLVIGPDSGPIHIAAAVGTSTVSLFRATEADRNGPKGSQHVRLQSPFNCSPCLRKECPQNIDCANSIQVAAVLAAAEKLLREGSWKN